MFEAKSECVWSPTYTPFDVSGNSPLKFRSPVLFTSTLHTMASVNPEFSISVMLFAAGLLMKGPVKSR